jgi:DNA-binding GntR family transcriptional regulator
LTRGSDPTSEKLLSVLRPASAHVAEAFGISEGENVIHSRSCSEPWLKVCNTGQKRRSAK